MTEPRSTPPADAPTSQAAQFEHDRVVDAKLRALPAPAVIWFTWRFASRVIASLPADTRWRADAEAALEVIRQCIDGSADREMCEQARQNLAVASPHDDALFPLVCAQLLEGALGIGASARSLRWNDDPEAPESANQVVRLAAHVTRTLSTTSFRGDAPRAEAMAAERAAQAADVTMLANIPAAWWADSTSEFAVANWLAAVGPARDYWTIVMDIATERGISPYQATHELGTPPTQ